MSHSGRDLIRDWTDDPPPSDAFLCAQAAYEDAVRKGQAAHLSGGHDADAESNYVFYDRMIEAISTRQDLALFLLCAADVVLDSPNYNASTEEYWDALAGVLRGADELDGRSQAEQWKLWARVLSKATIYE